MHILNVHLNELHGTYAIPTSSRAPLHCMVTKWRAAPVWLLTYLTLVLVVRLSVEPGGFAHLHAALGLPLLEEF